MFTGIITHQSKVTSRTDHGENLELAIHTPPGWSVAAGDSININGICSTVIDVTDDVFSVTYMPETRSLTTVDGWGVGSPLNLERSVRANDRLDGHIVQGHVDGVSSIEHIEQHGESWTVTAVPPEQLMPFITAKGSVTLDGVSLTVVDTDTTTFRVSLIPYTYHHTTLSVRIAGDLLNTETDIIARYLASLLKARGW